MARTATTGVWKKDSVKDVAESVGIANLPDDVAGALAGDVEYRLCELIEESLKFMRHSRRTRLKVEDIDQALKVRNLEPLWGFTSDTAHLPFKKTVTSTGTVYHVEDEEIDLSKVIKTELPSVPRDISFTAHWLAIEGVQPLIKENPTPQELAKYASKPSTASLIPSSASASGQPSSAVTPLVKHVLSRELQLYFTRLTEALGSGGAGQSAAVPSAEVRDAALGSVRSDPGLHQLVPYLIAWAGEQIANNLHDLSALQRALDLFHAMLENPTLFVEPYLHQLTPPILTCLLSSALSSSTSTSADGTTSSDPSPATIRTIAASLLQMLLDRHSYAYPSLLPRITKTLLRGLAGDNRGLGGRWGAARGLSGIVTSVGAEPASGFGGGGNRAIKEWVGEGLKALGEMIEREEEGYEGERANVVREVFNVLHSSLPLPPSNIATPSYPSPAFSLLEDRYGSLFATEIENRWDSGGRTIWELVIPGAPSAEEEQDGEGMGQSEQGRIKAEQEQDLALDEADEDGDDAEGEDDDDDDADRSAMEE
ncbi:hypothetical protein JCM11251_001326 [Rhodosporidiobolus azoricus]